MFLVQGTVYVDPNLPDASPTTRQSVYKQMVHALAQLHNAPVQQMGLQNYGNSEVGLFTNVWGVLSDSLFPAI